jgi:hypothetical protein
LRNGKTGMRMTDKSKSGTGPIGTLAFYGPDNLVATKVVAAVFDKAGDEKAIAFHRWISQIGDVREDKEITTAILELFKKHGVQQSVVSDRIMGCPHEEGIDYPSGGVCPQCPFWWARDRFTHELEFEKASPSKLGRNDRCRCGSGKKFKMCCGK